MPRIYYFHRQQSKRIGNCVGVMLLPYQFYCNDCISMLHCSVTMAKFILIYSSFFCFLDKYLKHSYRLTQYSSLWSSITGVNNLSMCFVFQIWVQKNGQFIFSKSAPVLCISPFTSLRVYNTMQLSVNNTTMYESLYKAVQFFSYWCRELFSNRQKESTENMTIKRRFPMKLTMLLS